MQSAQLHACCPTAVAFYDCGLNTFLLQALLQQRQQLLLQLRLVKHCQLVLVHF
jgi:hypothetical protein